jgi:3-deoxy-D-manno-octulosonic-acid transferase
VLAVSRLVKTLDAALPEFFVAVSTTTRTGQELARERFGAERVFYCPLDLPWAVRSCLEALQPRLLVLVETEFWPNLLRGCYRRRIPVAVVNARISDRSWPRYRRLRWLWRPFLEPLGRVLAQSETDAARLKAIGCRPERVSVAGNLKFDVRAAEEAEATRALKRLAAGLRLVVAGSTLEGEEAALLEAWPRLLAADAQLAMVLAPRHPERFGAVAALLDRSGLAWVRRSDWRAAEPGSGTAGRLEPAVKAAPAWPSKTAPVRPGEAAQPGKNPLQPGQIVLLDTIGELASVYSLASVAFVGGSLIPAGGHNPLEPAQFGVPIVMGPHYANFRSITEDLLAHQALCIAAKEELAATLTGLLADSVRAEAMGERARQVFASQAGATGRSVEALQESASGAGRNGAARMKLPSRARRLLFPLIPLYRLALAFRELRLLVGWSRCGGCVFPWSASAISRPAARARRRSPSLWPRPSNGAACAWMFSPEATAARACSRPASSPEAAPKSSATNRC